MQKSATVTPLIQKAARLKGQLYQPKIAPVKQMFKPTTQTSVIPSINQGVAQAMNFQNGQVDLGSSLVVGSITATNITVSVLSAITESVGNLIVNEGGSISSGETAYATGIGFWLGTDPSGNPQFSIIDKFGNAILFDGSSSNAISVSSTGVINVLTSKQIDDFGWRNTSVFGGIAGLPTTRAGYGITDAQATLPLSSALRQALFEDNGGNPYWATLYDTNFNSGTTPLSNLVTSSTALVQWGPILGFTNPGQAINIMASVTGYAVYGATSMSASLEIQYSTDGGVTWVAGKEIQVGLATAVQQASLSASLYVQGVTPTGDVQIRVMVQNSTGSSLTYENGTLIVQLIPVSNFYTIGTLVATIPATETMGCSAYFPLTTCTATSNVTVSGITGVGPFTFSWAVVSGTGTITSGSTAQTCTVTDTETTASPGATSNTTVDCKVTDSQSYATTAGTRASGTATLTIGAHFIPMGATVTVSGCTPTAYNGTFVVTGVAATTISYALAGTGNVTVQGTVNNVNITTSHCVMTGTFTRLFSAISASVTNASGNCNVPPYNCGNNCAATATSTVTATGGNGSYTYSWSVTSGGATIASGGSAATCHFTQTSTTTTPNNVQNNNIQCSVNDTRGTGAFIATGTLTNTFTCNAV